MTKKKNMRMLALLLVFVVLLVVYFVLNSYNADEAEKKAKKEADETVHVTDISSLTGITYESQGKIMSLVKEDKWYAKDKKDFPLSQETAEKLEETLKKLTATREFKDADALEDYGLKEPLTTFTLTDKDGKETKLYIGETTGEDCYVTTGEKSKVYTVTAEPFSDLKYDLNSMAELDKLPAIGSGKLEEAAVTEKGKTTTYKASDKKQAKTINAIEAGLGTFAFTSCANYKASDEDLKTYGLDKDKRITVKYTYKDEDKKSQTLTLHIGKADESGQSYYIQKDDSEMVCLAEMSAVNTILNKSN